jgi:putative AbiEi antitoxin of type IV toxin-antitoxin system/transcriptional regulator with AbiEi antitoxin domain of type IV toxin-antitoxin system
MAYEILQPLLREAWRLAARQHGVVARRQLVALGLTDSAIKHRLANGRLHRTYRGVYAVGRPELSPRGRWMAAVLSCGPQAALSHASAAALWGIRPARDGAIEVSVPIVVCRHPRGVVVHRRIALHPSDLTQRDAIPVTAPISTLLDLATGLSPRALEAAINEADRLGLTDPEALRAALNNLFARPGGALAARYARPPHVHHDRLGVGATLPAGRAACWVTAAADRLSGQRIQGRLLLARSATRGGDGWPALPPHAGTAGSRPGCATRRTPRLA